MLGGARAYSGFSVDDVPRARTFYGETLGLKVSEEYGMLAVTIAAGAQVLVYPKPEHVPGAVLDPELPQRSPLPLAR